MGVYARERSEGGRSSLQQQKKTNPHSDLIDLDNEHHAHPELTILTLTWIHNLTLTPTNPEYQPHPDLDPNPTQNWTFAVNPSATLNLTLTIGSDLHPLTDPLMDTQPDRGPDLDRDSHIDLERNPGPKISLTLILTMNLTLTPRVTLGSVRMRVRAKARSMVKSGANPRPGRGGVGGATAPREEGPRSGGRARDWLMRRMRASRAGSARRRDADAGRARIGPRGGRAEKAGRAWDRGSDGAAAGRTRAAARLLLPGGPRPAACRPGGQGSAPGLGTWPLSARGRPFSGPFPRPGWGFRRLEAVTAEGALGPQGGCCRGRWKGRPERPRPCLGTPALFHLDSLQRLV